MEDREMLTDEHIDYLKELVNIGIGNAATALSHILSCEVNLNMPKIFHLTARDAFSLINGPNQPVACVKLDLVGEILGEFLFVVSDKDKNSLVQLAEKVAFGRKKRKTDLSVLSEISNIMAGVYLTAIHDLSRLNIYQTVPEIIVDAFQPIIDELINSIGEISKNFIVVEHEMEAAPDAGKEKLVIKAYLFLIPSAKSVMRLADSINAAMDKMKEK